MSINVIELGCAGHFIGAASCGWRRHSQIGDSYRVSTVGDYVACGTGMRVTVGSGDEDFFETMVFKTLPRQAENNEGCGCFAVEEWDSLECDRYATSGAAQKGHEAMIAKYAAIANQP